MAKQTNKFKVKINTPFTDDIGSVYINDELAAINASDYPDIYEPIYVLEDGTEVCLGEQIWRSKNYEVKSTRFSEAHISQKTPIFGTRKNCEKWLKKNSDNIKTELLKQNSDSSFQTLKSLIYKLDGLETLTPKDLETIRDAMKNCISNIERV